MNGRAVKIGGCTITVLDDQPTFWDRVEAGQWEPGTFATIDRLVDAGTTFLDLGAWVGPTTLYAAARARRVVAVEADPSALDQLGRNLAANPSLAQRVTVVPRAVHAHAGVVALGARRKPGDSMSSILLADGAEQRWHAETVTPENLAALLDRDDRLMVKMDIEGAEYGLLPAMGPILARTAALVVSFHPKILAASEPDIHAAAAHTRAALRALAGFTARPVTPQGPGRKSLAPRLVRWGLRGALPGEDWVFERR